VCNAGAIADRASCRAYVIRTYNTRFNVFHIIKPKTSGLVQRRNMRHRVKFCEDRSNRSGDMADFRFSGWRPSAILDLFYACWDHPQRVFAHPWAETPSYDVNIVKIGQLLRARREPKNKAKKFKTVYLRSHNRCSPIPPTL